MKTLCLAALLCTCSLQLATAQNARVPQPITGPVRDAGVFHVGANTWTRHSQAALIGPAVIYNNDCPSGLYSPLSGDTYVDEGRLPGLTSPNPQGCASRYTVNGFQIAYCTDETSATFGTYTVNFYESYMPCASVIGVTPTASFPLNGLPNAPAAGVLSCWIVNLDLTSTPFSMNASGNPPTDHFGWSMSSNGGNTTGPLISGDPNTCPFGAGTEWSANTSSGTGTGTMDQFRIEGGPTAPGCYYFGPSGPFASFHLRIDAEPCAQSQSILCAGDGIAPHTACPCGNNTNPNADAGCKNSFNVGAQLRSRGTPSLSADTLTLLGNAMVGTSSCLYFQGTSTTGNGSVFGDGLLCTTGNVVRIGTKINAAGASHWPGAGDPSVSSQGGVTAPGTRIYQIEYRNNATFCTAATFNTSNGLQVLWVP